jgi:hypothetical protein
MSKPWSPVPRRASAIFSAAFPLLLLGAASQSAAADPGQVSVNETRSLAADGRLSVECLAGSLTFMGGEKNEVAISGAIPDLCKLEITGTESHLRVNVKWPERHHWLHHGDDEGAQLTIHLPRGAELTVNTVSANIEAQDVSGELSLESVSGDVTVAGTPKSIEGKTVSGNIQLGAQCKRVTAETVSGDLLLDGPTGELELSTVSGDLKIRGGDFEKVGASSVSGDIRFRGNVTASGHLELSTHSGTVEATFPASISADFQVETFSGSIDSDFGGRSHRTSRYGPGRNLDFSAGSGDAEIELSSFSGDVTIRKE